MRNWIDRASSYALTNNGGRVTKAIFERAAIPNHVVLKLALEAQLGESLVADCLDDDLAQHFGLTGIHVRVEPPLEPAPQKRRKQAVGQRAPSRDPAGFTNA